MKPEIAKEDVFFLPCICAGCCTIARFNSTTWDESEVWVEFYAADGAITLRERVKRAWQTLLDHRDWTHCLALDADSLTSLRGWIDTVVK